MEIEGVRLLTISDKDGGLIDVEVTFTATNGNFVGLYAFHKHLNKAKQETVENAIEGSKRLARMKEKVKVLGKDPDDAVTQHVSADTYSLVPQDKDKGLAPAKIFIGKVGKGGFSVRLSIEQKKGEDKIILEVPFKGDPGALKGESFEGVAEFLIGGSRDVAKAKLELYNIGGE